MTVAVSGTAALKVIVADWFALRRKPTLLPVFEYSILTNDCLEMTETWG